MIFTIFSAMFIWYICQPIVFKVLSWSQSLTQTLGVNTTGSDQTYTVLRLLTTLFVGVFVVIIFIAYGLTSAQERDWRGYY